MPSTEKGVEGKRGAIPVSLLVLPSSEDSGIHYCCKFNASWKPGSDTRLAPRFGYVANVTGRKAGTDTRLAPGFTTVANSTLVGNLGAIPVSLQIYAYVANVTGRKPGTDTRLAPRFGYIANVTGRKPGSDTHLAPGFTTLANATRVGNLGWIPVSLRDLSILQM